MDALAQNVGDSSIPKTDSTGDQPPDRSGVGYPQKVGARNSYLFVYHVFYLESLLMGDRHSVNQHRELLLATQKLISADTREDIAEIGVTVATDVLEMTHAAIHLYEEPRDALVPIAWSDSIEDVLDLPPALGDESLAWSVYQENTLQTFEELQTVDGAYNPETPFHSEIIVPLGDHGVLLISFVEAITIDESQRQIAEILGTNVTAALDRISRERSLRSFERAVEQSGHAIIITDTAGTIEYVNPAFEELTGYAAEEAIGRNPRVLKSDAHDPAFYEEMWETILGGEVWQNEIVNERKDGERFVVDQTIAPIYDGDGTIKRFVAVNKDITDLKERERNLELLSQVVRHDIRNDLQLIQGYTDLLEDHVSSDGQQYLGTIQENVRTAIDLTQTARELSEVILKSEETNYPVSLDRTLRQQIEVFRADHPDATVRIDEPLPRIDVTANTMLDSVFRNLLQNAVQHTDKETAVVIVSADRQDDDVTIRVADNGPGIPDPKKEKMLQEGTKGLESAGTGIGLYLVQSLVTSYDGEVRIEDNTPEGAVFVVRLPVAE